MTGGQLQLNSYKGNRSFLNKGAPLNSFFKKVYYQYNNYAKILYTIDLKQNVNNIRENFNTKSKYKVKVPKNGDLIKELYLQVKLPTINGISSSYSNIKWVKDIQFKLINNIKFKIGGQTIQEFDSDALYFYYTLLLQKERKGLFAYISNQNYIDSSNSSKKYLSETQLTIPIPVWFADIPFPIVCLEYMDLEIEVELNSIYDLLLVRNDNPHPIFPTTLVNINRDPWRRLAENEHETNGLVAKNFKLYPELKTNYIFLENKELINYFTYENKFLIEIYRKTYLDNIKTAKGYSSVDKILKYKYETIGCTRDVIIAIRQKSSTDKFNQHFNFTNLDDIEKPNYNIYQNYLLKTTINQFTNDTSQNNLLTYLEDFIIDIKNTEKDISGGKYPDLKSGNNNTNHNKTIVLHYDEAFRSADILTLREQWDFRRLDVSENTIPIINNNFKKDIIEEMQVKFNNIERIEFKDKSYFQELEFYKNYPSSNNNSIYVINFSLFPDKPKPSGQCNFSHIQKVHIDLKLNLKDKEDYELLVYNRYYNILELAAGSAKLIYFK
uniref:Major capsid protein N-terminal domain-containing protein n=1 Tax=viral metagenome TaxID=1070528 RepID=A0A6C0B4E1_9ZZZZ